MPEIWILDDDRSIRFVLAEALREAGFMVRDFDNARSALHVLPHAAPDAVFTDIRMPGVDGLGFLDAASKARPGLRVVVMSAYTDVASTSAAFRGGAFDYLAKPFDLDHAVATARRAVSGGDDASRGPSAPEPAVSPGEEPELIGESPAMRELFRVVGRVAGTRLNVLVTGDTGTGKELVARALHRHSPRAHGPFVALNTAAVPSDLLESELFGHEAGAFTGASKRHAGRFEQAAGGTLFLDEIGDMPLALQTRLLRVLAAGEYYRVGGRELLRADVRIVAATHRDLARMAVEGSFREDLLHRLDVVRIALPPLSRRREDVPALARHFLARAAAEAGLPGKRLGAEASAAMLAHDWPGNVRELENLCRRLSVLVPGPQVEPGDLPWVATPAASAPADGASGHDWIDGVRRAGAEALARGEAMPYARLKREFDAAVLAAALEHTDGHRSLAAVRLGLGRNTITRKLGSSRRRGGPPT